MTNSSNDSDDAWDVLTATLDGGVIWRRYSDGRIVVTHGDEDPQDVADREDENEGDDSGATGHSAQNKRRGKRTWALAD